MTMTTSTPTPSTITLPALTAAIARYPTLISTLQASKKPSTHAPLTTLDDFRYTTLPASIATRRASQAQPAPALLTKPDLVQLVTWKLAHGTFRPALMKHVASNTEELVATTLRDALALLSLPPAQTSTPPSQELVPVLAALAKPLKGIGPATASLVLSVVSGDSVPFFSDELYRWCCFSGLRKDWRTAEIKYNLKEYAALVDVVREIRERFKASGVADVPSAVDLEKAAYVWARSIPGKDASTDAVSMDQGTDQTETKRTAEPKQEPKSPASKSTSKRKATAAPVTGPLRTSSRRKLH